VVLLVIFPVARHELALLLCFEAGVGCSGVALNDDALASIVRLAFDSRSTTSEVSDRDLCAGRRPLMGEMKAIEHSGVVQK